MKFAVLVLLAASAAYGQNAALRYWSAFAQMQDSTVTPDQAKELNAILEGTAAYGDLKQRDLVERNRPAVETMQRGAELDVCDWGLEYQRGVNAPIEYVRKALALGRLNVLFAFHQAQTGDYDGAVRSLARGLRFAQHVSAGGPLFSALVSKSLLISHLKAVDFVAKSRPLSVAQRQLILAKLPNINWQAAMDIEFDVLAQSHLGIPARVIQYYRDALNGGPLDRLQRSLAAMEERGSRVPKPERVIAEKRELDERVAKSRAMLTATK